jgi:hypothetical protein
LNAVSSSIHVFWSSCCCYYYYCKAGIAAVTICASSSSRNCEQDFVEPNFFKNFVLFKEGRRRRRRRRRREPHPSMSGGRKAYYLDIVATHTYLLDSSIPPSNLVLPGHDKNPHREKGTRCV